MQPTAAGSGDLLTDVKYAQYPCVPECSLCMRIAYLSDSTIPSRKANGIQVMNMCQAFANAGHDVTLFARPGDPSQDHFDFYGVAPIFEIVKTSALGPRRVRDWVYAGLTAREFNRRAPFDLIYGRSLPALAITARRNIPFIYEAHQPASLTGRAVERLLFCRDNLVRCVFISEGLRTAYFERYAQLRRVETLVAHDGTTVSSTQSNQTLINADSTRLRVGYCGSLYSGRGIEIICALAGEMPDLDFHICGGSSDEVNRCRAMAADCRNITFHGFLPPSQTRAWQTSMDVLLAPYQLSVPTVQWMSPLKIFEYMASGKAIIASDLPALREVFADGHNSLLVSPNNIPAWVEALKRFSDFNLRTVLGQQAFDDLCASYTWSLRAQVVLRPLPGIAA
jgi:glycosyltransferase involved in cell wall biosynthesis